MARPITVPKSVQLPAGATLKPMQAYRALGISRVTAKRWRASWAFPGATRRGGGIDTQHLAMWLTANGCRVEWI